MPVETKTDKGSSDRWAGILRPRASGGSSGPNAASPALTLVQQVEHFKAQRLALTNLRGNDVVSEAQKRTLQCYFSHNIEYYTEALESLHEPSRRNITKKETREHLQCTRYELDTALERWDLYYYSLAHPAARANLDSLKPKPHGHRPPRIDRSPEVRSMISLFLRQRHEQGQRTFARGILDLLVQNKILTVEPNNKKGRSSALRAVQRYMAAAGFMEEPPARAWKPEITDADVAAIRVYTREIMKNRRAEPGRRLRLVWIDEANVHHHFTFQGGGYYDPLDSQAKPIKRKKKGQRYEECSFKLSLPQAFSCF